MDMYLRMRGPQDKQVKNVEAAAYFLIKCPSRKALESLIHEEKILKAKEAPIRGLKNVLLEVFRNNMGEQRKVEKFIQSLGKPKKHSYMEALVKDACDSYVNYLTSERKYFKPATKLEGVPEPSLLTTAVTQGSTTATRSTPEGSIATTTAIVTAATQWSTTETRSTPESSLAPSTARVTAATQGSTTATRSTPESSLAPSTARVTAASQGSTTAT